MLNEEELKALIEHEKQNLRFYVLFEEELSKTFSKRKLEERIDFHLDRMINLLRQLKD
jgi:hypothetical protein